MDAVVHRRHIAALAERLVLEFAGTMPAGQILRVVHQTNHLVLHCAGDAQDAVLLCEVISRHILRAGHRDQTSRAAS